MTQKELECLYFDWITHLVLDDASVGQSHYRKLFEYLHRTEFIYILPMDSNRESDGTDLRYRFAYEEERQYQEIACLLDIRPASVLEVMVALAIRCESIMEDPKYGNRTAQWFWEMRVTLGLGNMDDIHFDEAYVSKVVSRFMAREYEPNGKGGLFHIEGVDLRGVEIWTQMNWYFNRILFKGD